ADPRLRVLRAAGPPRARGLGQGRHASGRGQPDPGRGGTHRRARGRARAGPRTHRRARGAAREAGRTGQAARARRPGRGGRADQAAAPMTWSYSGDPGLSAKDEVRFLVGDTDPDEQLVTDEEIEYALDQEGSVRAAAVVVCESIQAGLAKKVDKAAGAVRVSLSQTADHYAKLCEQLRKRLALGSGAGAYAGGISRSDKKARRSNADRVEPAFRRGMHDNHGTLGTTGLTSR